MRETKREIAKIIFRFKTTNWGFQITIADDKWHDISGQHIVFGSIYCAPAKLFGGKWIIRFQWINGNGKIIRFFFPDKLEPLIVETFYQ